MQARSFFLPSDGISLFVRNWRGDAPARGIVIVAHGAAEHSGRYERFAEALVEAGFCVYAPDHRGHGHTAGDLARAGNAGVDGFNGMIRDLHTVAQHARSVHPGAPLFLLGHSMGAALSQRFIQLHGELPRGVLLSGSPGLRPNLERAVQITGQHAQGDLAEHPSELFKQSFAHYNDGFAGGTGYEWLSRDAEEVRKYVDDPWCGFPFTNRLLADMSRCALEAARVDNIARIPKRLGVLFLSGTEDRVGGNGEYVKQLAALYRQAGIIDVNVKLYPEARHELLNDINRAEVEADVVAWLVQRS